MKRLSSRTIDSGARFLVALYLGMLLAGPAPVGFARFIDCMSALQGWLAIIALPIPWVMAGFIAGRRMAIYVGILGFFSFEGAFLPYLIRGFMSTPWTVTQGLLLTMLLVVVIPAFCGLFAWLGGRIADKRAASDHPSGSLRWRALGLVSLLLLGYSLTSGPKVALRTLQAKYPKEITSDTGTEYWHTGLYPTVTLGGDIAMYGTDPTGMLVLYKDNGDDDPGGG